MDYKAWLDAPFDEATQREVRAMGTAEQADAFSQSLSFGTGGMRGIMGAGTNRMNAYTVRAATQGLANYLKKQPGKALSVFIGYDTRKHSREFASIAARVLTTNGIRVFFADEICPTPLVSFGCRHFGCSAAIMITASHNPPEYNGYKVYWSDGGQVVFPHDEGIIEEVRKVDIADAIPAGVPSLVKLVEKELDEAYLQTLKKYRHYTPSPLQIIYSPLHGTGLRLLPPALKSWGYESIQLVEKQANADPQFTSCKKPNPEEPQALALGTEQLLQQKADLFFASDPDADRLGLVVLHENKPVRLTGNQIACIALHHLCTSLIERGEFPENGAFIKSIVTTELFRKIAEHFGGKCLDVLTGFKYIAEKMTLWEKSFEAHQFLFGAEESYGYLFGTMVRDKDAISSACLLAEAAAQAKKLHLTLVDRLQQIYRQFGLFLETLLNFEGADADRMKALMATFRAKPPTTIGNIPVSSYTDYLQKTDLPKSDVLRFILADQSRIIIRPSGTEPKVKVYLEVVQKNPTESPSSCEARLQSLVSFIKSTNSH
jgi:phosphomannomutase